MVTIDRAHIKVYALLITLALAAADPRPAFADEPHQFAINTADATRAIHDFGTQSGVQILASADQLRGKRLNPVVGTHSTDSGFRILLAGTGLTHEYVGDRTVALVAQDKPSAKSEPDKDGQESSAPKKEEVHGNENANADDAKASQDRPSLGNTDKGELVPEIVVTGSHIPGEPSTSPVLVITREDIDRQGLATAADIVRSVPQNFSSVNPGSTVAGRSGTVPIGAEGTASADLRGLGPDATLVLVNGRRLGGSAVYESGQINLSTIPASAIERVEIVLDGASAIYGADAIAGVINFILKSDYTGATTTVRYNDSAHDANSFVASQTIGFGWSSGSLLTTLEHSEADPVNSRTFGDTTSNLTSQGGTDWRFPIFLSSTSPASIFGFGRLPDSFDGTENWTAADLIPVSDSDRYDYKAGNVGGTADSEITSLTLSMKQAFGARVDGFLDLIYSKSENTAFVGDMASVFLLVPASNPFNRLGEDVFVSYLIRGDQAAQFSSDFERINLSLGANIDLGFKEWKLTLDGTFGAENAKSESLDYDWLSAAATENLFGDGSALDTSRFVVSEKLDERTRDTRSLEAVAHGRVFAMPGGDANLAIGSNYRPQKLDLTDAPGTIQIKNPISSTLEMDNIAYFFEMNLPLVGSGNQKRGVHNLLLNIAGRYEDHQMDGHFRGDALPAESKSYTNFSPRFGLRWRPAATWTLRSSWGESFKAPNLTDIGGAVEYFPNIRLPLEDPRTGTTVSTMFGRGGNPDLRPETSETWTFGTEWRPLEGLLVSATYTDISWTDRIDLIQGFDPRIPNPDALGLLEYDVPMESGGDGDPNTLDAWPSKPINLASRKAEYIDALIGYGFDTSLGRFDMDVAAVFTVKTADVVIADTPEVEVSGTEVGPDKDVVKAHLGWSTGRYGLNLYGRYSSSYDNVASDVQGRVGAYSTYDITGSCELGRGMKLQGGVLNITNADFPFFDSRFGNYDSTRVDARGRTIYAEVSKSFDF